MRMRLEPPASRVFTQQFIQAQIKENFKAPRHWPLWGEFAGDRWIPCTKGQWSGKCFHLMTSSWFQQICRYWATEKHPGIVLSYKGIWKWIQISRNLFFYCHEGDCTKSYWDIINGLAENLVWQNACQPHVRAMLSCFYGHCHSLVYHEATRHIYVGLPLSSLCIPQMRHIDLHVLIIIYEYWAALVMKSEVGLIQSGKAIHGNCWYIGYPLGSHLEPKFRLFIKSISLSQSINKFAQSAELSLPCSVKSCEMTGQVRNNSWAMRFRQICIQCEFRKGVLYCNISRSLMTTQGTATEV